MRKFGSWAAVVCLVATLTSLGPPAAADHTDPSTPLAPTTGVISPGLTRGEGTWEHIANFPGGAGPQLTGGGTDLEFFSPPGTTDIFGAFGTLGQDNVGSIGQRILKLTDGDQVAPAWVADHGSAHCPTTNPSGTTGLQHDSQVGRIGNVQLLVDTTDATGRCHDPSGGGLEIIDVSKVNNATFKPREVHLLRLPGFSHTHTIDRNQPWIVYNSSSDFAGRAWIDVVDIRSCFGAATLSLNQRRSRCRPSVYRIPFQDEWTQQRDQDSGELEPGSAACHDITFDQNRLYCAAVNATLIIDVSGMRTGAGGIRGQRFPCTVVNGTQTGARVTDCSGMDGSRTERARGWQFLGTFNHPGRDCDPTKATDNRSCNNNIHVPADEGVSISHEADPSHDDQFMFVTDERGGGIVPPGASCTPGIENPTGNGGAHALNISDPANIDYATTPTGEKSVYISDAVLPAATFCDIHVIELIPGEQRFIAAYYSQGIKIVDYFVDNEGHVTFEEVSSFTLTSPNPANTWAAEQFKMVDNPDGTRTYFIAADDIHRGVDIVSWTGDPNPIGSEPPIDTGTSTEMNLGLIGLAALMLPAAAALGRRRRRRASEE